MIVAHIMGVPVEESVLYTPGVVAVAPALLIVLRGRLVRLGRRLCRPASAQRKTVHR
jgi:hypothetical protein